MQKLLEQIAGTAELMGHTISPIAAAMMAKDLSVYPQSVVIEALRAMRNSSGRFSQSAVVKEIERLQPDGRLGADEAWAMVPRDEYTSVVLNDEIARAIGIAQPLLDEGDQVAARMAFKQAYERIVAESKTAGNTPVWYASLGWDKNGREPVILEAVRLGRISANQAMTLLPDSTAIAAIEDKRKFSNEQIEHNIKKINDVVVQLKAVGKVVA